MKAEALGHVVLQVRNLERSIAFYRDLLGLPEVARLRDKMVFFSFGDKHHDLALYEIGDQAAAPAPGSVGLYHVALKVGDSLDVLRAWKARLEQHGVVITAVTDHHVSQSLYLRDPDGITIELYVDADVSTWKDTPGNVATVKPLQL